MISLFASGNPAVHSYHVPWFMYGVVIASLLGYAYIEWRHTKHDHVIGFKEALNWSIIYISLALAFGLLVLAFMGSQAAGEYYAAWAIEKALSLDNLFVIGIIFASLKVPKALERRMLNYGIAGAIFFRLLFILVGFELLKRFEWIGIFFGIILLHAAWEAFKEAIGGKAIEHEVEIADQKLWKFINKIFPIHHDYDGHKLTTRVNGKFMFTMMFGVILLIEGTDIIFAVDSVPAVLAVSPDRFIAYSSNVFALLGLRALFFVYQAVEEKFWALSWALAGILAWIAFKLIVAPDHFFGWDWFGIHVPIGISLGVLLLMFGGSIAVSLIWKKQSPEPTVRIEQ